MTEVAALMVREMIEELILCDECRDRIRNSECDPLQMRFILHPEGTAWPAMG